MRLTPETLPVVSVTTGHADKGGKTLVLAYSKEIKRSFDENAWFNKHYNILPFKTAAFTFNAVAFPTTLTLKNYFPCKPTYSSFMKRI